MGNTRTVELRILGDSGPAVRAIRAVSSPASKMGSIFRGIGFGIAGAAATGVAGLGALAVSSVKTASEFQSTMKTIDAVTQTGGRGLEKFRKLAIRLGSSTVFSANEAAQGILELSKSGVKTADIMGGGLKQTLSLATAGEIELGEAAKITANAMNVFGLKGTEAQQAADALAGAANASSANVDDIAQALSQAGTVADASGLSIQETTAALAAFADAGIKGSDAGTSLKTMLLGLTPTTSKAKDAIAEYNLELTNQDGSYKSLTEVADELDKGLGSLSETQQAVALKTIFGTDAFRAANIVMKEGAPGLQKYIDQTSEVGTAQDVAKTKMEGFEGAMETLRGVFETIKLEIGDALLPVLEDAAEAIGKLARSKDFQAWLQSLVGWIGDTTDELRTFFQEFSGKQKPIEIPIHIESQYQKILATQGQKAADKFLQGYKDSVLAGQGGAKNQMGEFGKAVGGALVNGALSVTKTLGRKIAQQDHLGPLFDAIVGDRTWASLSKWFGSKAREEMSTWVKEAKYILNALFNPLPDIQRAFSGVAEWARGEGTAIGMAVADGLTMGLASKAQDVVSTASNMVSSALGAMWDAVEPGSPSKVTIRMGKTIMAGLVVGLESGKDNVLAKLDEIRQYIRDFEQSISGGFDSFGDITSRFSGMKASKISGKKIRHFMAVESGQAKRLARALKKLARLGLNAGTLSQIAAAGPDAIGLAEAMARGGKKSVKQTNRAQGRIDSYARGAAAVAGNQVNVTFQGNVYGFDDFKRKVMKAVNEEVKKKRAG